MLKPGYYCVQQMGHVSHYGWAEEVEIAGAKMLQITLPAVPGEEIPARGRPEEGWRYEPPGVCDPLPSETVWVGGASLYAITSLTEEQVIERRKRNRDRRIVRLALPAPEIEEAEVVEDGVPFDDGEE